MNTLVCSQLTGQQLTEHRVTALFVSPSEKCQLALKMIFSSRSNWRLYSVRTCEEALELLRAEPIPVVVCDHDRTAGGWRTILDRIQALNAPPRLIVTAREPNERLWAQVLEAGGYDLLATPWDSREVLKVISLAWRAWEFAARSASGRTRSVGMANALAQAAAV
jgi:DNA-binding response OmpR family regulator